MVTSSYTSVEYSYLQSCQSRTDLFSSVVAAFDCACGHLDSNRAMPVEIICDGQRLYGLTELAELFFDWEQWRNGAGIHPLTGHQTKLE